MEQMCDLLIERVQALEQEEGKLRCGQWLSRRAADRSIAVTAVCTMQAACRCLASLQNLVLNLARYVLQGGARHTGGQPEGE